MSRWTAVLALACVSIGLIGCAMEWSRPGTSEQEVNADKLTCERQATQLYPVVHDAPLAYRPAATSKLDTSCVQQTGLNNCEGGNEGVPSTGTRTDANDYNRTAAVKACLTSKGYTYKKAAR